MRPTLGPKRENRQQVFRQQVKRACWKMASIAVATFAAANQICTAVEFASGSSSVCTATAVPVTGRYAHTSDHAAAAIFATCIHAECFRDICTGVSVHVCTAPECIRSRFCNWEPIPISPSQCFLRPKAVARSMCPEQVRNAFADREVIVGPTHNKEHAIQTSCRSQSSWKGRKTDQHFAKDNSAKSRTLAHLRPAGQRSFAHRSPSLPPSGTELGTGIDPSSRRFEKTTTTDFRTGSADVYNISASRNVRGSSNEHGSRWILIPTAMECPCNRESTESTASYASVCTTDSYARSSLSPSSCFSVPWIFRPWTELRTAESWIFTEPSTWIFSGFGQWILWPIWVSEWISTDTATTAEQCRNWSTKPRCLSHAISTAFTSQLLREFSSCSARSSSTGFATAAILSGVTTRKLEVTRAHQTSDLFHGRSRSDSDSGLHPRTGRVESQRLSPEIPSRVPDFDPRDHTDDGTSKESLWDCAVRTRAASSTVPVCTGQPHAPGIGQAAGRQYPDATRSSCSYTGTRSNDPCRTSCPRDPSSMQRLFSSVATIPASSACTEVFRSRIHQAAASRCNLGTSNNQPVSGSSPRNHCSSGLTRVASGCLHSQSSQASARQCSRPGGRRGRPEHQRLGVEDMRPSVTMHLRADDLPHGNFGSVTGFVDLSQHSIGSRVNLCNEPVKLRLNDLLVPASLQEKQFWTLRDAVKEVQQPWPSDFLWTDLEVAAQLLPDLAPELQSFLLSCPNWHGEPIKAIHLFTDGSASTSNPAAWSLVVVFECWLDDRTFTKFCFRGFAGSTLQSLEEWIRHGSNVGEVEADALSAELCGLVWALGWALQAGPTVEFHFHYDNVSAGHGAFGQWNPPVGQAYSQLVKSVTGLRQILSSSAPCTGHHIKAHSGAPWNELADAVAKALAKGILCSTVLPLALPKLLHHPMLAHAWTEVAVNAAVDLRSCCEWPSLFTREGPMNPLSADTFWNPPSQLPDAKSGSQRSVQVTLRIGTANVLTLDCGAQSFQKSGRMLLGRIGFLRSQFEHLGLHIVGLQETRSHGQVTRHNQSWWVFQSGCTEAGTHGIEIWISKQLPYGIAGARPLMFLQQHFTVLAFHSRYLLLEVDAPSLQVHILCLHSPFAKSAATDPGQFWQEIDHTLDCVSNAHWPLIVLGDFNAKLGSLQSDAVSNFAAESESELGNLMHRFMLCRSLCAPSTFGCCHSSSSHTWKVGSKAASRIDYVLVPLGWLDSVVESKVHLDVDLLTEDDHQLVSLSLCLKLRDNQPRIIKPPRPCPRSLQDASKVAEFLTDVEALAAIPWTLGVGHHTEALTCQLQDLCRRHFAPTSPQPLQRHFSASTWNLVTIRHTLLRTIHRLDTVLRRTCGLLHLRAWFRCYAFSGGKTSTLSSLDFQATLALRSNAFLLKLDLVSLRKQLQRPARQSSRQDRIIELKSIAERFVNSASLTNTQQVHRALKPLLGPHGRKAVLSAKPLPAVRTSSGTLAQSRDELAQVWQDHFAAIEGGQPVTPQQLQAQVHAFSTANCAQASQLPLDLEALPTLAQVESVIRRSKAGKAPGPDNLPAAIFKLHPAVFARLLYPLYLKISIRCQEPLKFRGGEIIALAKRALSRFQCTDFRAIVLADQMEKYFHTMQRQKLLPYLASFKSSMQAGCTPGTGVDHVHLQLETYSAWTAQNKRSFCTLFVDVASAYYKAVRSFIVAGDFSDAAVAHLFQTNGWQPDLLHEFLSALKAPSAFEQAQVSPHLQFQIRACLQSTWFSLRNLPGTLTGTGQGTRPGNPLADLLFAFLFSRVTSELHQQLDLAGLLDHFPLQWLPNVPFAPDEQESFSPSLGSWADDLYIATSVAAARDLTETATTICAIAIDVSAKFGLALNLGSDKTNLVLVPRGSGSFEFKRQLASSPSPHLTVATRSLGFVDVQIVRDYVHLGTLFDGISCRPEIQRRYLLSAPLVKHLRRSVFGVQSLAISLRSMLLQSYVLSRFMFGSSTWHFQSKKDYQQWFAHLLKLFSVLLPQGARGPGFQSLDLLSYTHQLHPALLLAKHRLVLLHRMFDHDHVSLWSVLQASQLWCDQTFGDLHCLAFWVPEFPGWGLSSSLESALAALANNAKPIPALVRTAEKRFFRYLDLWRALQEFRDTFFALVLKGGATLQQCEEPPIAPLTHQCTLCDQQFASFHGLTSHLHKWHGIKNLARRFAISNTCRHCLMTYDNRENLVQHLKHLQTGCLISLIQTVAPLSMTEVQALDTDFAQSRKEQKRAMRNNKFRFPPQRSSGPLRPPLWRTLCTVGLPTGLDSAPQSLVSWTTDVWEALCNLDSSIVQDTLHQQPCTALHVRSLIAFLDSHLSQCFPELRIHLTLCLDNALAEWFQPWSVVAPSSEPVLAWRSCVLDHNWQLLADVRVPQVSGQPGINHSPNEWLQTLSEPYQVVVQMQHQHRRDLAVRVQWPRVEHRLCRQTAVVVYLFSGRRREGDLMSHLQELGHHFGMQVSILLIDLALSEHHNVRDPKTYNWLCGRIRAGEISAVLVAPPCETWSRARNRRISDDCTGPRVLRTPQAPWCREGLKTSELLQLEVANALMFISLQVAVVCLYAFTPFVMEHPADPEQRDLVTVWRTWPVQWLLRHEAASLRKINQSDYGAAFRKPTMFLSLWMPHFFEDMQVYTAPTPERSLRALEGRDAAGFTTRLAKEYPSHRTKVWLIVSCKSRCADGRQRHRHLNSPMSFSLSLDL